jgi:hypothetical protein
MKRAFGAKHRDENEEENMFDVFNQMGADSPNKSLKKTLNN